MPILDEIKEQQKKAATMSWKGKLGYFWDYYKIPTLVILVVLIFSFFLIKDMIAANRESLLQAAIINSELSTVDASFQTDLESFYKLDPKKQVVTLDNSYRLDLTAADQMTVASSQKLIAILQVKELDVMIAPADIIDYYTLNSFFADLSSLLTPEQIDLLEAQDLLYYAETEEKASIPVGIDLSKCERFTQTKLYTINTPILAVAVNSTNNDAILRFLTFLELTN